MKASCRKWKMVPSVNREQEKQINGATLDSLPNSLTLLFCVFDSLLVCREALSVAGSKRAPLRSL